MANDLRKLVQARYGIETRQNEAQEIMRFLGRFSPDSVRNLKIELILSLKKATFPT